MIFRWARFRLQFGITTLLVIMTLLAVCLGIYASPAKRQGRAVKSLEKLGAEVSYDYQREVDPSDPRSSHRHSFRVNPPGPQWARRILGEEFFQTPDAISFKRNTVALRSEELQPLKNLPGLVSLHLDGCGISDDHLVNVAALRKLDLLSLTNNRITDDGLASLAELNELETLSLSKNQIKGMGLQYLATLPHLRELFLYDNPISDDELVYLAHAESLEMLGLAGTKITDDGLKYLEGLLKLRYVSLTRTQVTREAAARLRQKLPACEVER